MAARRGFKPPTFSSSKSNLPRNASSNPLPDEESGETTKDLEDAQDSKASPAGRKTARRRRPPSIKRSLFLA